MKLAVNMFFKVIRKKIFSSLISSENLIQLFNEDIARLLRNLKELVEEGF